MSTKLHDEPRQAAISDVNGIINLIKPLEAQGTLAKRTKTQLKLDIDHFSVTARHGLTIGCAALYPADNASTGELLCLAIHENYCSDMRGIQPVKHIKEKR